MHHALVLLLGILFSLQNSSSRGLILSNMVLRIKDHHACFESKFTSNLCTTAFPTAITITADIGPHTIHMHAFTWLSPFKHRWPHFTDRIKLTSGFDSPLPPIFPCIFHHTLLFSSLLYFRAAAPLPCSNEYLRNFILHHQL